MSWKKRAHFQGPVLYLCIAPRGKTPQAHAEPAPKEVSIDLAVTHILRPLQIQLLPTGSFPHFLTQLLPHNMSLE